MDLKFPKPNIMLIDMSEAAEKVLQESGYNVSSGSFGTPQKVPRSDKRFVVSSNVFRLPNYQEQEVLIINLEKTPVSDIMPQDDAGEGVVALWQQADHGVIDPRPYCMAGIQHAVDRILRRGGIAIVFLDTFREVHYEVAARKFGDYRLKEAHDLSNWSFTSDLEHLECLDRCGTEIEFLPECGELTALLRRGAADAHYQCAVHPNRQIEKHWRPIAKNRFDDDVAGIRFFSDDPQSCLILLPQMPNVALILPELIGAFCPRLRPKLFPHHEANSWLHDERYEVPAIVQLFHEINSIKEEADKRIRDIEQTIQDSQVQNQDWYTLLNGTGDDLVGAVIRSLKKLGFKQVIDVDEQARADGEDRNLREDIQIHDKKPVLIVDVKGKTGGIEDSDATQSEKHALARSKEFQGEVKPLTIINCQRNLPPHDRDPNPYRQLVVENAHQSGTGLGLMTTWDVFRLLRNKEVLGWADEVVRPIFYRTGRIEPIPEHYVDVGTVVRVGKDWFGIIPKLPIQLGARLAIEVGVTFIELVAASLEIHNEAVNVAPVGSECGIAAERPNERFKKGTRVFLVRVAQPD